ncbi:MAG: UvrD-helicase domain-containing protein [Nanoarchaeota archaeon]|nr:UvrD-helicase domain-containing protein [Nanoarchaeota archaeon]
MRGKDLDYLYVLKALNELPFQVGKKLLIDILQGNSNESIQKNKLFRLDSFATMAYSKEELNDILSNLIMNKLIEFVPMNGYMKVLNLTLKGIEEIKNPTLHEKKLKAKFKVHETIITKEDKKLFVAVSFFLSGFTDEQKKAVVSPKPKILCIAGAGSGKTAVLTKRIEFLSEFKGVDPKKILAITFTRKAKQEMISRLKNVPIRIETFNSFCEGILKKYNDLAYDRKVRVISYGDKMRLMKKALMNMQTDMSRACNQYFTVNQRRGKTDEELAHIFMNDCFYFRSKQQTILENPIAKLVFDVARHLEEFMLREGLRDFDDQIKDTLNLFSMQPGIIPKFDHILVDEYQDINSEQENLLEVFDAPNLFCVGDPRQSIFGWRGSKIQYILDFEDKNSAEIITLTKNFRSTAHIVSLFNASLQDMGLPDLDSHIEGEKDVRLLNFANEAAEFEFVIQTILASKLDRSEIFVLARTNRQLTDLSSIMKQRDIKHTIRSEELKRVLGEDSAVTLATIHAIKGMEAELVFVIGATGLNFPCRGSDHPVMELIREEYDREEEEKRLFYVALSRAKKSLYISYTGKSLTRFFNSEMKKIVGAKEEPKTQTKLFNKQKGKGHAAIEARIKEWRREKAAELGIQPYLILHDKTIIELATSEPVELEDLEMIYGMGPVKVRRFGKELLDLIHS